MHACRQRSDGVVDHTILRQFTTWYLGAARSSLKSGGMRCDVFFNCNSLLHGPDTTISCGPSENVLLCSVALPSFCCAPGALVATSSTLSSSPTGSTDTMVSRMRAVLKRHQCGSEEEAVTVCMRQAAQATSKPSALVAGGQCSSYINSLRYCQLQTQQHNYPVALGAFLY